MSNRSMTLAVAAKELLWLWDKRHGKSTQEIADHEHISERRVRFGIARARSCERPSTSVTPADRQAPRLIPLFPIVAFTPQAMCAHKRDLRRGSLFCCMVCHRCGHDGHPALVRTPATDPPPEKKPDPTPPKKSAKETRAARRAKLPANITRAMKSA